MPVIVCGGYHGSSKTCLIKAALSTGTVDTDLAEKRQNEARHGKLELQFASLSGEEEEHAAEIYRCKRDMNVCQHAVERVTSGAAGSSAG